MSQLEEEVATCRTQVQQCQGELAGKEADNVSLYEKIRYLQRYSSNRQASSSDGLISVVQVDDAGVAQPKVEMVGCNVMLKDNNNNNNNNINNINNCVPDPLCTVSDGASIAEDLQLYLLCDQHLCVKVCQMWLGIDLMMKR